MGRGRRFGRRGSGPLWFVMLAVVIFVLYSVAVAASGSDACRGGPKSWQWFPPDWTCDSQPGFG